ncbi:hypothetical protein QUB10_33335 [Microcoleus sp. B5-D4]|uniref:hypothetical protein n=1 Tax=unclassified Microcoleus TaxID=2642155 RepID=UPI002FD4C6F6
MKISQLQTRYGLASKQSVYDRMKALQIVPISRGEISSESLDELDKLDKFLKNNPGAKIWEFPRDTESLSSGQLDNSTRQLDNSTRQLDNSTRQLDNSTRQLDNFNEILQLVEAIARHFAANQDPLANYKALEYAANHIILLPTSKIKELTGAKPSKNQFQRGTFVFTKTDSKIGRERAWRIQMTANAFRDAMKQKTASNTRWLDP